MANPGLHQTILQWIIEFLRSGIHLDRQILEFVEASYGEVDVAELFSMEESSDTAPFLDLVFQPSQSHRLAYEQRFGHMQIGAQTLSALLAALETTEIKATIHIPGNHNPVCIKVSTETLTSLVQRLNISWKPPGPLRDFLQTGVDDRRRPWVRARLRHSRITWHDGQVELVMQFLSRYPAASDSFERCFVFLLGILAELSPGESLFTFFTVKKRFFLNAWTKAEAFERRRKAGNMEILMMQGERAAHGSLDHWREQMQLVDLICRHLFGGAPHMNEPVSRHFDVQTGGDDLRIQDVMRILE